MSQENKPRKRKKPLFLRKDWHKMIKLGSQSKKNRKWRAQKGRHGKIRLGRKGQSAKPKIGWGSNQETRNLIKGLKVTRVQNVKDLSKMEKESAIIIAKVGRKNRNKIIEEANKMKLKIINNYKEKK
jgi:ribosomal protein L32E